MKYLKEIGLVLSLLLSIAVLPGLIQSSRALINYYRNHYGDGMGGLILMAEFLAPLVAFLVGLALFSILLVKLLK